MGIVADFEKELFRKSPPQFGRWHAVDLHNHSPVSDDYQGEGHALADRTAKRIRDANLSVAMFTDHERLPDSDFISEVRTKSGKVILTGTELNVFVTAFARPTDKLDKNLFYHLLVGFDPDSDQPPEYWLADVYPEFPNFSGRGFRVVTVR